MNLWKKWTTKIKSYWKKHSDAELEKILEKKPEKISELAIKSVIEVAQYLNLKTEFEICSDVYSNTYLSGQNRVLDICRREKATTYINPFGGMELYSQSIFYEKNIELFFIKANKSIYPQFSEEFVPFLSIIDVLMFNDIHDIHEQLDNFTLL